MGINDSLKALRKRLAASFSEPTASSSPGLEAQPPGLGIRIDAATAGWPRELLHPEEQPSREAEGHDGD